MYICVCVYLYIYIINCFNHLICMDWNIMYVTVRHYSSLLLY